jgi:peptidoglycan/LPS O-acetylase OafA/YrhL
MISYKVWRGRVAQGVWASPWLLVGTVGSLFALQFVPHQQAVVLLYPLVFALVVPPLFELSKGNPRDRWLGELTYPMYLVHLLVLGCLVRLGAPVSGPLLLTCAALAAVVLYLAVDRPVDALRQRIVMARVSPGLAPALPRQVRLGDPTLAGPAPAAAQPIPEGSTR